MSRNKGVSNYASNFEVLKDAPLDSRCLVDSYEDLIKKETWQNNSDNNLYVYVGMVVACKDKPGELYQLISSDYALISSWKLISGPTDFTSGLTVNDSGEVSIKIDEDSEFLSVSESGLKVSGIKQSLSDLEQEIINDELVTTTAFNDFNTKCETLSTKITELIKLNNNKLEADSVGDETEYTDLFTDLEESLITKINGSDEGSATTETAETLIDKILY